MNKRDTQFRGYAKLVEQEIYDMLLSSRDVSDVRETIRLIIARRFYDFACHVNQFMPGVENVPDIEKWDDLPEI
jgi:hypothetical protein